MRRLHAQRLSTTILMVLAMLFSQLALANYLCPPASARMTGMDSMGAAPGQPRAGMGMADESQPALCHQHCFDAPQSFEFAKAPAVSLPAVVQELVVPPVPDAAGRERAVQADDAESRAPPEPVFLSTLRLRV